MATYPVVNKKTGEQKEVMMSIREVLKLFTRKVTKMLKQRE